MYQSQPDNHNVGFDEHATQSSTHSASSSRHSSTASNGDQSLASTRSTLSQSVSSATGSQEAGTPDQTSPTISESSTFCSPPFQPTQQPDQFSQVQQQSTAQQSMSEPSLLILHSMGGAGEDIAQCFQQASQQPPITPESLDELALPRILNNPKLRHDCNFDRELHFRPNLDGAKGKQKIKAAEDYWKALEGELFVYGVVHQQRRHPEQAGREEHWYGVLVATQKRLPQIFSTIRDIIKTLVPDGDRKAILERLDVDLIMQEIMNGVCDLIDLGNWLAKVLKAHCAPMRDPMVDAMRMEITRGASEEKPRKLVNGIRQLLNVLEAMKLDVANHQIRHMRPILVEDTFNFQRKYNAHRISLGKIDAPKARSWLQEDMFILPSEDKRPTPLEALASGVLKSSIFYDSGSVFPSTFYLDLDRLRGLRLELHGNIYHLICRDLLIAMAGPHAQHVELAQAVNALHKTVAAIIGSHGRFSERMENIAAEIMRLVLLLEHRSPSYDSTLLDFIEQQLIVDFCIESSAFQKHAQDMYDKLLPRVQASVQQHVKLNALQLHDKLVPAVNAPGYAQGFGAVLTPAHGSSSFDPAEDLVRRFTHVIVLHWQVFADLVYLVPVEEKPTTPTPPQSPSFRIPLLSSAPTRMIAEAIYKPGHQFLPSGITTVDTTAISSTPTAPSSAEATSAVRHEHNASTSTERSQPQDPDKQSAS